MAESIPRKEYREDAKKARNAYLCRLFKDKLKLKQEFVIGSIKALDGRVGARRRPGSATGLY